MTLLQARIKARKYSDQYNTNWYVRRMVNGSFEPYAHDCGTTNTVAVFYLGKDITNVIGENE